MIKLFFVFLLSAVALAQSPQTQTAPIYDVNAKYVNGVAPGYAPTADPGGGPFLDLGSGTVICGSSVRSYPNSVFQLTVNAVNYVYLDTTAVCQPAVSTLAFTSSQIPIAVVFVSSSGNLTISDVRTPFNSNSASGSFCSLGGCTLSGNITVPSIVINGSTTITGVQGTDTKFLTAGTVSGGVGSPFCVDANGGATTSGCSNSGNATMLQGVPIAPSPLTNGYALIYNSSVVQWQPTNLAITYCTLSGCTLTGALTVPSFVLNGSSTIAAIQGTDTSLMSSGTVSGSAGTNVCLDANSGLTTSGCTNSGNATSIQSVAINSTLPITNQVIAYNGTQYIPTTLPVSTSVSLPVSCTSGSLWTNPSPTGTNNVVYECYSSNNWISLNASLSGTPSIGADSGAGTSPTVSLVAGSSDQAGWFNVTTGSSPAASAGVVTITFGNATYPTQPVCTIFPASAATAALSGTGQLYVSQSSSSSTLFVASIGSSALSGATAYKWGYTCSLP